MQICSVGIDLGKTTFHLVALGASGKVLVGSKEFLLSDGLEPGVPQRLKRSWVRSGYGAAEAALLGRTGLRAARFRFELLSVDGEDFGEDGHLAAQEAERLAASFGRNRVKTVP
jgi:hypothetical protein